MEESQPRSSMNSFLQPRSTMAKKSRSEYSSSRSDSLPAEPSPSRASALPECASAAPISSSRESSSACFGGDMRSISPESDLADPVVVVVAEGLPERLETLGRQGAAVDMEFVLRQMSG